MEKKTAYLIVNFGGPRDLEELRPFLTALLTDQDVIRSPFPGWLHRLIFTRVAKKRALKIAPDYELIGGKSPIYDDTQAVAEAVSEILQQKVLTFHRYIQNTHSAFRQECEALECDEIRVFPLFPQFSYATTGSIARWFHQNLSPTTVNKMRWIKSYPNHPAFLNAFQRRIEEFLQENKISQEETILLFSAHGLPQTFIASGDLYASECEHSFHQLKTAFPKALCRLSFQSQFGKGEWIRPYTNEFCQQSSSWGKGYRHCVVVPLSFTSDHIETLYEIEHLYLPVLREQGFHAWRCPALNRRADWMQAIAEIFQERTTLGNKMLINIL
jgi:ferrochelatase